MQTRKRGDNMIYNIVLKNMSKDPNGIHVTVSLNKGDYEFSYTLTCKGKPETVFYDSIIEDNSKDIIFVIDPKSIKAVPGKRKEEVVNYLKRGGEEFFKCFKLLHLLKKNGIIELKGIGEDAK